MVATARRPHSHLSTSNCLDRVADWRVSIVRILSDRRLVAFPHSGYRRSSLNADRAHLSKLIARERISGVVVGMPVAPSGYECSMLSAFVRAYSDRVLTNNNVAAIAFVDESYSTLQAGVNVLQTVKRSVKRSPSRMKRAIDANAASVILQDVLDLLSQSDTNLSPLRQ
jgi:RNase H-fold protein (predicted Holliday junction resolvase)